jgi:hypothetical protein
MTPTLALVAALTLSPVGMHSTTPDTSTTVCEAYGAKQHQHWVSVGATEPGTWSYLLSHGWSREAGTTAVVLFADGCSY